MRSLFTAIFLAQACLPVWLANQERPPAADLGANLPAQTRGARDLIAVSVYDLPELVRTVRVGADGFIRPPCSKTTSQPMAWNLPTSQSPSPMPLSSSPAPAAGSCR
jgi:hypothetical protein